MPEAEVFELKSGSSSTSLLRGRLWRVRSGKANLRLFINNEVVNEYPVCESGWFIVPFVKRIRVELVAITTVFFQARLPLSLIPRLGDRGREQLVEPIVAMLDALSINHVEIDWIRKLSEPSLDQWLTESLETALESGQPLSPYFPIGFQFPNNQGDVNSETKDVKGKIKVFGNFIHLLLMPASACSLVLGANLVIDPFAEFMPANLIFGSSFIFFALFLSIVFEITSEESSDRGLVGIIAGLLSMFVLMIPVAPISALGLFLTFTVLIGLHFLFVRSLLPTLPSVRTPIAWLNLRLRREGVPSLRERLKTEWFKVASWVIARIEVTAEFSRISRSIIATSFLFPAIESAQKANSGYATAIIGIACIFLLERFRIRLPVSKSGEISERKNDIKVFDLKGDIQFKSVVYRHHAGQAPLFKPLVVNIKAGELISVFTSEGAGLSTLLRLMTGIVLPESGQIYLDNLDLAYYKKEGLIRSIVTLDHPDDQRCETVRDWLFVDSNTISSTLEESMKELSIFQIIESLPNGLESSFGHLIERAGSLGMVRLKLSRALARPSGLIWLDNWSIGLSLRHRNYLFEKLLLREGTRIIVDKDKLFFNVADKIWKPLVA